MEELGATNAAVLRNEMGAMSEGEKRDEWGENPGSDDESVVVGAEASRLHAAGRKRLMKLNIVAV